MILFQTYLKKHLEIIGTLNIENDTFTQCIHTLVPHPLGGGSHGEFGVLGSRLLIS